MDLLVRAGDNEAEEEEEDDEDDEEEEDSETSLLSELSADITVTSFKAQKPV